MLPSCRRDASILPPHFHCILTVLYHRILTYLWRYCWLHEMYNAIDFLVSNYLYMFIKKKWKHKENEGQKSR